MSPSTCIRCARPLAVESSSGLCPECIRTVHSPVATPRNQSLTAATINQFAPTIDAAPTPAPDPGAETHSQQPAVHLSTLDALPAPARVPLPAAPSGYEILSELGLGGMGAVYLAREVVPDRLVAMKFLRRPGSQSAYDRFLVEVRALAALDHPNIIRFLSTDFFRSDPFFTTEYFSRGSLLQKVESEGPVEPLESARIMTIAARAVHAANGKNVIHRDLKPSNILLSEAGVPKVADFGLAKRLDTDDGLTTSTGPLGSPPYMAPEQTGAVTGAAIDARTDVYGLGATLYHLVTGRRPFAGDAPDVVIAKVLLEPPVPPRSLRPTIPRELEAIILKCLEKDPSRRYQTAEALAEDLDRFLAGQVPDAPLLTRRRRLTQWLRRRRRRIAAASGMALLVAGVLILGSILWRNPIPANPSDPVEEVRRKLTAGEAVTLIGATGPPEWSAARLGAPGLGLHSDGTYQVATVRDGLLELFPDPGIDRYRISADLRHLDSGPAANDPAIGLYFGYVPHPEPDGAFSHAFYAVAFREVWEDSEVPEGNAMIRFREVTLAGPAGGLPNPRSATLAWQRFGVSPTHPGPWRTVEIEVTPGTIRVRWKLTPGGEFKEAADLVITRQPARKTFVDRLATKHDRLPKVRDLLPDWSPRAPLGIWTAQAGLTVRNVRLEPLP